MPKHKPIIEQLVAAIGKAERQGMTRRGIARQAGVNHSNLARYCSGEIVPKLDTAEKIVNAIGGTIRIDF